MSPMDRKFAQLRSFAIEIRDPHKLLDCEDSEREDDLEVWIDFKLWLPTSYSETMSLRLTWVHDINESDDGRVSDGSYWKVTLEMKKRVMAWIAEDAAALAEMAAFFASWEGGCTEDILGYVDQLREEYAKPRAV